MGVRHPSRLRLAGSVALLAHLERLAPAAVARLLELRPDVLWRPEPRDLHDLSERLSEPDGIAGVLSDLPVPSAQLCEALSALVGRASLTELAALLGVPEDDHDAWQRSRATYQHRRSGCWRTPSTTGSPSRSTMRTRWVH